MKLNKHVKLWLKLTVLATFVYLNSHAAIAGKALLKPTIVGALGACSHIRDGLDIAVDCAHGSVQRLQA